MKKIIILFLTLLISTNAFAAGSDSSSSGSSEQSMYDEGIKLVERAGKLEKKDKLEKAKKRYEKAQALLVKSNKKKPLQANTLNYLGFTTRKLGDYENGEKYYLLGLEINPKHVGINEYLGELYVATNRIDLAKERLKILESCNCEEYTELKEIIDGTKKSKY